MGVAIMRQVLRQVKFRFRSMQPLDWLGWALWSSVALVVLTMLLPGLRHWQQLEQEVAALRRDMHRHQGQWIDHSPQATLQAFYQFLPAESEAAALVAAMFATADAQGITLDQAQYDLVRDQTASVSRYQIILPLHGRYPDIRRFVIALLNDMPALAVNELSFKREDVLSQEVDARLRLTIFLGHAR